MLKSDHGFTYLAAMVAIVLMATALSAVGRQWAVTVQRDLEAELLFRGNRIRQAIEAYAADYEARKGTRENRYPLRLEQLIEGPRRYLPVLYRDPITREGFDLIKRDGEILGVKSLSNERPFNREQFKDVSAYKEIRFEARPTAGETCAMGGDSVNPINPFQKGFCQPGDARLSLSQRPSIPE